ncbi:MAG TPA: hypothetical protein VMD75_00625, partial [Candidatus Binataceae bacterium]|nr:hypothetical protein [Candidatus Binataceae bacterium]
DEMIFSFTHTQEMLWMLPRIPPTNRYVEVALVAIVRFRDGKLAHEHIYWDQASVLKPPRTGQVHCRSALNQDHAEYSDMRSTPCHHQKSRANRISSTDVRRIQQYSAVNYLIEKFISQRV